MQTDQVIIFKRLKGIRSLQENNVNKAANLGKKGQIRINVRHKYERPVDIFLILAEVMRIMNKLNYSGKKMACELENVLLPFPRRGFSKIEES